LPSHWREREQVGSPSSCTGDDLATTVMGGGQARIGEEKDIGEVPTSPTFHFANSGRWRLGFGEEEREQMWEKEGVD
jgi:hypothetical protein